MLRDVNKHFVVVAMTAALSIAACNDKGGSSSTTPATDTDRMANIDTAVDATAEALDGLEEMPDFVADVDSVSVADAVSEGDVDEEEAVGLVANVDSVVGIVFDESEDFWWMKPCLEAGTDPEICNALDPPMSDELFEFFNTLPVVNHITIGDVILPNGFRADVFLEMRGEKILERSPKTD